MSDAAPRHTLAFLGAAGLLCLLWAAFGGTPAQTPMVLGLAGLVLVLGLPHGALDLWVARRSGLWAGRHGVVRFHGLYLALAGAVVLSFLVTPTLALLGFLALSVWHFSDDWRGLPIALRVPLASAIVLVPCLAHPGEAGAIFAAVTGDAVIPPSVPSSAILAGTAFLSAALAATVPRDPRAAAEAAAVIGLAIVLPPLLFFAAYFVLLHGPRHMLRHRRLFQADGARTGVAIYTALALGIVLGLGFLLARAEPVGLAADTLRALFVGLAALSVPHAFLVEYDRRRAPSWRPEGRVANAPA